MPYKVDMHFCKCQAEPTDVLTAYATDAEGFCGFAFVMENKDGQKISVVLDSNQIAELQLQLQAYQDQFV